MRYYFSRHDRRYGLCSPSGTGFSGEYTKHHANDSAAAIYATKWADPDGIPLRQMRRECGPWMWVEDVLSVDMESEMLALAEKLYGDCE